MIKVEVLPILTDNYVFVIHNDSEAFVVDPGTSSAVDLFLEQNKLKLVGILNTHHHYDHIDGNDKLKKKWNCDLYASELDKDRIPNVDFFVKGQDTLEILNTEVKVLFTPGHTYSHVSYYFPKENFLFCGDTLFSNGCGRIFDGTLEQLFNSLNILKALPPKTQIFCTHEYTLSNINFALTVDKNNTDLIKMKDSVTRLREKNLFSIPSTIGSELLTNPFLRCDSPSIYNHFGLEKNNELLVFKKLRSLKDNF